MKHIAKYGLVLFMAFFCANVSFGYEVWFGLPYMPKDSQTRLDDWDIVAPLIEGLNLNNSDTQRPNDERNEMADWRNIVQQMTVAKDNGMIGFPRTHFNYGTVTSKGTLEEVLVTKFKLALSSRLNATIKWVMPFDNQPGEDRTAPVYEWTDAELQQMRDWLDSNGHAEVQMLVNARAYNERTRVFCKKTIMSGMSIEAKASLWYAGTGNRKGLLRWAVEEPLTKDKHFKFQMPFGKYERSDGVTETPYQAMRGCMRWLCDTVLYGNLDFMRRDDVTFLVIIYDDNSNHLPETSDDGSQYVNSILSLTLSIIEQRDLFEGRTSGGLITKAQTMSYQRNGSVIPKPTAGLVAHWPLDEGAGTTAADASGYGFDGDLLNGVTWGSDAERGTYAVFDGTNDRIETTFSYALADTNDFTWAWWAKKEPSSHSSSIMVGNRYGNTGTENLEFIKMMPSKGAFANTASAAGIEDYNYTDIPASSWNHYAMVKSGTSYQWYVDGVAQGSPVTINYNETSPLPFLIGGDDDGSGTKVNEHFEGCIDDVILYREALTPVEVVDVKNGNYPYGPPVIDLIAGWDTWDNTSAPAASFATADVTASATASATGGSWSNSDGSGRGSSKDTTWGTYDGGANPASAVTTVGPANFTLTDGKTDGEITFTITNTGTQDIVLDRFHFDAVAFRPNAARTYALNVLAGSDITVGNVLTSADDAITSLAGNLLTDDADPLTHDQHDDIDIDLSGLADHTLSAGETAILQLAFSSGTGSGGGHHLFVDNVGISGVIPSVTDPEPLVLEMGMSGDYMILNWSGSGFKVQSRTNLMEGIWIDVPGGDTPPMTNSLIDPEGFFRLIEQ